ncbi:helix-turn-helix transcriptional regulator [Ktedonosporobacter rubrisoli]|uniref:helix-turn-helix transcriptional regulator n=1 Tax=Ktedonosporobacter rubrisoli TaxID=2509675 RepID=UPI0013EEC34E|nr:helix-turn-helix transcriptional regulator [Ktedonosporobacter rubrisoli]
MVVVTNKSRRALLANFLRTRRARLSPSQIGLPAGGRRRTPGLRREEVALAAGVSVAYYTWLEQARDLHVSRSVLESIANALRLSADERLHLLQLADHLDAPAPVERQEKREKLDPLLQRLLDSQGMNPAIITGPACDIRAWNRAACAVFGDFSALPEHERNILWLGFVESTFRQRLVGWEDYAQEALAVFRAKSRHVVDDPDVVRLVDELERVSPEFRQWWPQHNVRTVTDPSQEIKHPQVGRLVFEHLSFQVSTHLNLRLCIWLPDPASNTLEKLEELLKWEDADVR